jgi:hypothetical protein
MCQKAFDIRSMENVKPHIHLRSIVSLQLDTFVPIIRVEDWMRLFRYSIPYSEKHRIDFVFIMTSNQQYYKLLHEHFIIIKYHTMDDN